MKCSPKLWKQFSKLEQKLWTDFYETFLSVPETLHADWSGKKFKEQREVSAHNMACEAV